ncbi:MAG: hypothetical protein JJU45_15050 [Acidimicrobiia bacterium]|nr:hypothetical protein [Acidimicrobiia bacterium]
MRISSEGLAADAPDGWEGEIYVRPPEPASFGRAAGTPVPVLHLANFALPAQRGDYGGGAVELMGRGDLFISLLEHDPAEADTALFALRRVPWPLRESDFAPQQMQRTIAGQSGCQRFFSVRGRAFCLYVVLGSHRMRAMYLSDVNDVLAAIDIA